LAKVDLEKFEEILFAHFAIKLDKEENNGLQEMEKNFEGV
jgi:hypothetical protein